MLKPVMSTWCKANVSVSHTASHKPSVSLPPRLLFYGQQNSNAIDRYVPGRSCRTLNAVTGRVSIAYLWGEARPDEACQQNVQDYVQDTYVNTNFHDYYCYGTDEFRRTYEERYYKRPYVIPSMNCKW